METRNQPGMRLENPSLLWSEINQDYAQKTVQNLELAHETIEVPQLPIYCSKTCKLGTKVVLPDPVEFPKMRKN